MNKNEKTPISEDVALKEFTQFLSKYKKREFRKGTMTKDRIFEDYPNVIDAIMDGLLTFKDNVPVLTLREPIDAGDDDFALREITFRTRIRPSDQARIMDGLNLQTQQAKYVIKFLAYVTGLAQGEIDLLDKEDYDTINQLASVF